MTTLLRNITKHYIEETMERYQISELIATALLEQALQDYDVELEIERDINRRYNNMLVVDKGE